MEHQREDGSAAARFRLRDLTGGFAPPERACHASRGPRRRRATPPDRRPRAAGWLVACLAAAAPAAAEFPASLRLSGFLKLETRYDFSATPWTPASKGGNEAAYFPDADGDGVVDARAHSTTWIRRARLIVRGDVAPSLDYAVLFNLHLADRGLGSAEVHWRPAGWLTATAGQFKLPVGIETVESSHRNPTINRALVSERLTQAPAYRDLGAMVEARATFGSIALAGVQGNGHNRGDDNGRWDWVTRATLAPLPGVTMGHSTHLGRPGAPSRERRRHGADVEAALGPLRLRAEYLVQRDALLPTAVRSEGWYALLAARLGRAEPVARIERFDPNARRAGDDYAALTAAANWYVAGDSRLSLSYEHRRDRAHPGTRGLLSAQVQVAF
jgi:hypothetical protein